MHFSQGSQWNASNLEELNDRVLVILVPVKFSTGFIFRIRHILNVTREIDNFFLGIMQLITLYNRVSPPAQF